MTVLERMLKLFGFEFDREKVEREIQHKRREFKNELNRLELLATETRVQGRDYGNDSKPERNSMGSGGDTGNSST